MMFPRLAKVLPEPAQAGLRSSSGAGADPLTRDFVSRFLLGTLWAALPDHLWAGFLAAAAFQLIGAGVLAGLRRRSA